MHRMGSRARQPRDRARTSPQIPAARTRVAPESESERHSWCSLMHTSRMISHASMMYTLSLRLAAPALRRPLLRAPPLPLFRRLLAPPLPLAAPRLLSLSTRPARPPHTLRQSSLSSLALVLRPRLPPGAPRREAALEAAAEAARRPQVVESGPMARQRSLVRLVVRRPKRGLPERREGGLGDGAPRDARAVCLVVRGEGEGTCARRREEARRRIGGGPLGLFVEGGAASGMPPGWRMA